MKKIQISWVLVVVLSVVVAIFAYKFTVGNVAPSDDGRQTVILTKDERNAILLEMRVWLSSVQGVLNAALKNDIAEVEKIARASGMQAEAETPGSLFRKIPLEMKKLGFATRAKFDEIAEMAKNMKSNQEIMLHLSETMNSCIACHDVYRLVAEPVKK